MAKSIEEQIEKCNQNIQVFKDKRKVIDDKIKAEENKLENLKKEQEFEKISILKHTFDSEEDFNLFIEAVESKDTNTINELLKSTK